MMIFAYVIAAVIGWLLGYGVPWLVDRPRRRRRQEDMAHLAECQRHSKLAAEGLKDGNLEKYEAHMVLAVASFERMSKPKKKEKK